MAAGWTKDRFLRRIKGQPRYCAVGALIGPKATEDHNLTIPQQEGKKALEMALCQIQGQVHDPYNSYDIYEYNDEKERKKADILKLYDRAIANVCEAPSDIS